MPKDTKVITGSALPPLSRNDVSSATIITKLNTSKLEASAPVRPTDYFNVVRNNMDKIRNNDNIMLLFPDIEKCIQIITASILSPNNVLSTSLTYTLPSVKLPDSIKSAVATVIEKHVNKTYKLEQKLSTILRESYFVKGSYVEAIVSEAAVDEITNPQGITTDGKVDMDAYRKLAKEDNQKLHLDLSKENLNLQYSAEDLVLSIESGFNAPADKLKGLSNTKENYTLEDLGIDIIESKVELFRPQGLYKQYTKTVAQEAFNFDNPTGTALDALFRYNDSDGMNEIVSVSTSNNTYRDSFGTALIFKVPVESVIPVHVINDPSKHLGYFIMLDERGAPITLDSMVSEEQMGNIIRSNTDSSAQSTIINRAKTALHGITNRDPKMQNIEQIYTRIVDETIRKTLAGGTYGDLAEIKENTDIYRVMFFRALKAKKTKLIYMAAENIAYYAFDFRENGTGKSLIEKTAMLHSIRSILLFTKILASVKNSTTTTKLSIQMDEDEIDPQGVIDQVRSEYVKKRSAAVPYGLTGVNDMVGWAESAGVIIDATGGGIPDIKIETSEQNTSKVIPDESTDEMIRSQIYMAYGLSPEIVESGYNADFATTVVAKNLLFAKQTNQLQIQFTEMVTNHIRKLLINDAEIRARLSKLILGKIKDIKSFLTVKVKVNKDDVNVYDEDKLSSINKLKDDELVNIIVAMICTELEASLPTPELTEAQALHDAFQAFKNGLEENIEAILPSEVMNSELIGELGNKGDIIKGVLKTVILRKWMADNNYMPELSEFIVKDEGNGYAFDAFGNFETFVSGLGDTLVPFLKSINKLATNITDKINVVAPSEGEGDTFGTDDNTTADGTVDEGTTTDGADEFGTGDDEFSDDYTDPDADKAADDTEETDPKDDASADIDEALDDNKVEDNKDDQPEEKPIAPKDDKKDESTKDDTKVDDGKKELEDAETKKKEDQK